MKSVITYDVALDHFKTPSKMAKRLGCSPQAIYQWGGVIPELRQYQIIAIIEADQAAESVEVAA